MAYYPSRDAIDPLDFRDVFGDVVLIEVRRAPTAACTHGLSLPFDRRQCR